MFASLNKILGVARGEIALTYRFADRVPTIDDMARTVSMFSRQLAHIGPVDFQLTSCLFRASANTARFSVSITASRLLKFSNLDGNRGSIQCVVAR
jgi:hypothetical protein